ncbi:hypothetical protein [Rurimicrobium arvi]
MQINSTIAGYGMGTSLSRAWDDIKSNVFLYAGFSVVFLIVYAILSLIPFLGMLTGFVSFIFNVSIFAACHHYRQTGQLEFGNFFSWSPKFGRLFLGNLIYVGLAILVMIPLVIISIAMLGLSAFSVLVEDPQTFIITYGSTLAGIALMFVVVSIIFGIWFFAYFFLLQFTEMSYSEALKASWKIGRNNIVQLIAFVLLSIGLSLLGVLVLIIGLAVTFPLLIATQYHFMRNFVPESSGEDDWDIMKEANTSF